MPVSRISTATAVTSGFGHSCALLSGGIVTCWGWNGQGQLGDGTTTNAATPVRVSGISTAIAVTAGESHSCALLAGGTVTCWGYNADGQLGNGTTTDSVTPVGVSGITTAIAVSAGVTHSCALLRGGSIKCWGSGWSGELGNGTETSSATPVRVSGMSNAIAVSAGKTSTYDQGNFTCALQHGGTVKCWGYNAHGQLGNGTTKSSTTPVKVKRITTATAIATGREQASALLAGGIVTSWGALIGPRPVKVVGLGG